MKRNEDKEISNLYHIRGYTPLAEAIDRRAGYVLLKNLCPRSEHLYAVAVEDSETKLPLMATKHDETWVSSDEADAMMRELLGEKTYDKATSDFMGMS